MKFHTSGIATLLVSLLLLAACNNQAGSHVSDVREAELADSVFLAPPVAWGGPFLVCFRFEVTQAEYRGESIELEERDLPATQVNRSQASEWAAGRGMRLPTVNEWVHLRSAGGTQSPPAGNANTLELGIAKPLPVGVFERSRTPLGGYDFDGNVWEWLASSENALAGLNPDPAAMQIGGSFASYSGIGDQPPTRIAHELDQSSDVGFRPVADALPWLKEQVHSAWLEASVSERRAFGLAFQRWRPELRRQVAQNWLEQNPQAADFADFLQNPVP